MTFFEKYACVFLKKSKANPESSMLIPEFSIKLKQKRIARQEKRRCGGSWTCHGFVLSLDKRHQRKPIPGPGLSPRAPLWATLVCRPGRTWPPALGAESEGRVRLSPTVFIRSSVSVWGEFFPVLSRCN